MPHKFKEEDMLKLAAKAAGVRGKPFNGVGILRYGMDAGPDGIWNSLDSDKDALRLLAILIEEHGFEISEHNDAVCLGSEQYEYVVEVPWRTEEGDPMRIAITSAGAVVGHNQERGL